MIDRPKGKSERPSDSELISKVAATLFALIQQNRLDEFLGDRLSLIIQPDFRVSISNAQFAREALVSIPLKELDAHVSMLRTDASFAPIALDMAARQIISQIKR